MSEKPINGIILLIQGHFQGQKGISKVKKWRSDIPRSNMIFLQMKPGASVILHFHVILTGQSMHCIMYYGHFQGQKVNFKVK